MHSYSHNYDQIYASVGAFSKDLMKLQKYLYDLTEVKSYIYRFPGAAVIIVLETSNRISDM